MPPLDESILAFWGKARPLEARPEPGWHPLAFHCLDVAAVGRALLKGHGGLTEWISRQLRLPPDAAIRLMCFLLCLHDIGKFAKKFQAKEPIRFPECFGDNPARLSGFFDHGAGGMRLFDDDRGAFGLPGNIRPRTWRPLISAVTGHHGSPPEPRMGQTRLTLKSDFGAAGIRVAHEFIRSARSLFSIPPRLFSPPNRKDICRASYAVAGLAVLADWIGSNQSWFPYRNPDGYASFDEYWDYARNQSTGAIREAGVLPAPRRRDRLGYEELIGAKVIPTPMQDWVSNTDLPVGPSLFMIEDETGSGKTEAALMLAHRLMKSGSADGLYVALPTMATANAMFDRLALAYRRLFAKDAEPSIALAHGARGMHEGFRAALPGGGRFEAPYANAPDRDEASETTASAACAAWIADDRRRTFLADAGAGTIDQALLSVLPSRHQSLRLLGLMRRVLILDEVHAYDAYMQREMEMLLEFQAGLGGSAILLSATLPLSIRERLTDAFAKGLASRDDRFGASMDYPMATVCADGVRRFAKVAGQPGRARTLPVRFLRSTADALREVERAARAGQAVLYIRNTVDDALDAHAELTARGLDRQPKLFHARFALGDRLEAETGVVELFGKRSESADREGRVLVATQVVEQSLDLDFDAVITDLAPIDLLIQRAGRLWRHDRPERKGELELLVVGPEPVADADEKWFGQAFPRAQYVYRDHARLWLTARTLEDSGKIVSPARLRTLIESVYGDEADARMPSGLQGIFFDAEGKAGAERGVATTNTLNLAQGYVWDGGAWDLDVRTPTRLVDDPQVTLRLARFRGGRIEPYAHAAAPDEAWRAWRLSEVNVSARRIGGEAVPPEYADAARAAKASWTRFDSDKILVVLEEAEVCGDATLSGTAASGGANPTNVRLRYHPRKGLSSIGQRS